MQRNTTTTRYYVRPVVTDYTAVQAVTRAYQAAGLEAPTTVPEAVTLASNAPDLDAVALDLARDAHTANDPAKWYAHALDTLTRAQAAVKLRDTLRGKWDRVAREHLGTLRAQAVQDISPKFDRLAETLSKDAKKLPDGHSMFDSNAILEADASAPFKRTREALGSLALLANLWPTTGASNANFPPEWVQLLPVVHVPEVTQERVEWITGVSQNTGDAHVALTAREISSAARRLSLDHVVCQIAAGQYEGYRLELADADALAERRARLHMAFTQRVSKPKLDPED